DVLVGQVKEPIRLLPEVVPRIPIENDLGWDSLESYGSCERLILGQVNLSHSALPHEANDPEPVGNQEPLLPVGGDLLDLGPRGRLGLVAPHRLGVPFGPTGLSPARLNATCLAYRARFGRGSSCLQPGPFRSRRLRCPRC